MIVGRLVGTQLTDGISQVYPAAGYANEVQDQGGLVAVFNLERSNGDGDADFRFLGPCEVELPRVLGLAH
jgi:NAD-dependent deacetylase sirtuin 5